MKIVSARSLGGVYPYKMATRYIIARLHFRRLSSKSKFQEKFRANFKLFEKKQKELGLRNGCISLKSEAKPEGMTFLLGWLGSKTKTLAKYAEIHQVENMACCCINPTVIDAHLLAPARAKMKKLFRAVETTFEEKVPVMIHAFSGGSNAFLYSLLPLLSQESSPLQLKGVIFDSGPTEFIKETGMAAGKLLREQKVYTGLSYYVRLLSALSFHALFGDSRRAERLEMLQNKLLLSVPHLYLYSEEDPVFRLHQARSLIQKQCERGVSVFEHSWKDRSHVRLYPSHPEEYKAQVLNFMSYCSTVKG